jgi:uncharacterized protein YecE (DUF72 family)
MGTYSYNFLKKFTDCLEKYKDFFEEVYIYFDNTDSTTDNLPVGLISFSQNKTPSCITNAYDLQKLLINE